MYINLLFIKCFYVLFQVMHKTNNSNHLESI